MSFVERLGIVDGLQARAAFFAGRHPHLARRIEGKPPIFETWKPVVVYVEPPPAPIPLPPVQRPLSMRIIEAVSKSFEVTRDDLLGRWRPQRIVYPRMACYRLIRDLSPAPCSLPTIGRIFKRDHTTVMSGLARTEILLERDRNFRIRYLAAHAELVPT